MSQPVKHDPSPEQIREACAEIQATWTASEKLRRLRPDLRPTYRRCDGEQETMSGAAYEAHHRES